MIFVNPNLRDMFIFETIQISHVEPCAQIKYQEKI
jgi:hypothetical protein